MTRGRRPNLALEPSRQLLTQRAFRERKAAHLRSLEEAVQRLEGENAALRAAAAAGAGKEEGDSGSATSASASDTGTSKGKSKSVASTSATSASGTAPSSAGAEMEWEAGKQQAQPQQQQLEREKEKQGKPFCAGCWNARRNHEEIHTAMSTVDFHLATLASAMAQLRAALGRGGAADEVLGPSAAAGAEGKAPYSPVPSLRAAALPPALAPAPSGSASPGMGAGPAQQQPEGVEWKRWAPAPLLPSPRHMQTGAGGPEMGGNYASPSAAPPHPQQQQPAQLRGAYSSPNGGVGSPPANLAGPSRHALSSSPAPHPHSHAHAAREGAHPYARPSPSSHPHALPHHGHAPHVGRASMLLASTRGGAASPGAPGYGYGHGYHAHGPGSASGGYHDVPSPGTSDGGAGSTTPRDGARRLRSPSAHSAHSAYAGSPRGAPPPPALQAYPPQPGTPGAYPAASSWSGGAAAALGAPPLSHLARSDDERAAALPLRAPSVSSASSPHAYGAGGASMAPPLSAAPAPATAAKKGCCGVPLEQSPCHPSPPAAAASSPLDLPRPLHPHPHLHPLPPMRPASPRMQALAQVQRAAPHVEAQRELQREQAPQGQEEQEEVQLQDSECCYGLFKCDKDGAIIA